MKTWKILDPVDYYSGLTIPDDWESLEDFVEWFVESKYPIIIPWNAEVRRTDDATTICLFRKGQYQVEIYLIYPFLNRHIVVASSVLFRKGQYQVEIYLIYPGYMIQPHQHPGVEVITMNMGGGKRGTKNVLGGSSIAGTLSTKLNTGEIHGGESSTIMSDGYVLLSFEKWSTDIKMTSAAIHWKGPTAGPIHDKLIEKYYPGAVTNPGYADVTLCKT